ncbi:MAG: heme-binding protein [Rhodobacteraceae bacterium]|nr:heme-binding protein [Paracoccaceae bacterium]
MPDLSLARARRILRGALAFGRNAEMRPLAVVVLDAGGALVACEREDGSPPGRVDIARAKANGVAMMGIPGSRMAELADARPAFIGAVAGIWPGGLVPVQGGVLALDSRGRIMAAIGVSGDTSENDAAAAVAGIEASGLVAQA